jgi:hypothetical protein
MRTLGRFLPLIFLPGLILGGVPLERAAGAPLEEQAGLKVGDKAPPFTLLDQTGKERSLDEFLGRGRVAIVFYRSASW